uniref:glycylpeptide N-tetradecanoyltransferase n=1 Tax=viral metagenome TaxID=1070528 RepID=A0A6C0LQX9_9ZZZZ
MHSSNYWINQPVNIIINKDDIRNIIDNPSEKKSVELLSDFNFKTLNMSHLDEIYCLLLNHYIEDCDGSFRFIYSRDYLYWYLKYIPLGLIVGLTYRNKLVGLITATFIDLIIYDYKIKVPFINLLCLQKKIRSCGLCPIMIDEIKLRILKMTKINYAIFFGQNMPTKAFCCLIEYVIPMNCNRLKNIGLLSDDHTNICKLIENPLHLMKKTDVKIVINKLNNFLSKYDIKQYFTFDTGQYFLLPKKHICYSFVNRDDSANITDFISVYLNLYYCVKEKKMITSAKIAHYFYESMSLTKLITYLIDKLLDYEIDQLYFSNMADNSNIEITKYLTKNKTNLFFYNVNMLATEHDKICLSFI